MKKSLLQKHNELKGERSNMLRSFVENEQSGIIDSIFQHSFNIQFQNLYFHIGNYSGGLSVLGITVNSTELNEILDNISLDDLVIYKNNVLKIYSSNKIFQIDLLDLEEVNLNIPKVNLSLSECVVVRDSFKELKIRSKIGLDDISLNYIIPRFNRIDDLNNSDLRQLIGYMLGRGKGLTPSGDDMLVGFSSVLISSGNELTSRWLGVLNSFSKFGTTKVSTAYLEAVKNGYISKDIKKLMLNMKNDKSEVIHGMQDVLQMGHTSGADTLFGMNLAINEIIGGSNNG